MRIELPLDKMNVDEKLSVLEQVWEDLQRHEEDLPVPAWHEQVLKLREQRIAEGTSRFIDWTEAKRRIRE